MTTTGRTPGMWCLALAGVLTLALSSVAFPASHGEPGEVQWWDLLTEDAGGAAQFYSALLGWEVERGPKGNYVVRLGGKPIAGISQIEDALPGVSETTWLVGITVPDIEAASAAARRLGARKHRDGHVEGYGRWAAFEDPQGAPVLLISSYTTTPTFVPVMWYPSSPRHSKNPSASSAVAMNSGPPSVPGIQNPMHPLLARLAHVRVVPFRYTVPVRISC